MDLLIVLALIFWIISNAKKNKKAEQQRKAARERARETTYTEHNEARAAVPMEPTVQLRRHPLGPSHETGHAHTETSITGISDSCPPIAADTAAPSNTSPTVHPPQNSAAAFQFDPALARDGLIYAEILGKPKALRR